MRSVCTRWRAWLRVPLCAHFLDEICVHQMARVVRVNEVEVVERLVPDLHVLHHPRKITHKLGNILDNNCYNIKINSMTNPYLFQNLKYPRDCRWSVEE